MVKFGLAKGKLKSKKALTTKSAFGGGDDDNDDDETGMAQVNTALVRTSTSAAQNYKTRVEYQKALEEDATVFEYDQIYDDVKSNKEPPSATISESSDGTGLVQSKSGAKSAVRKSRYVEKLMAGTESRTLDRNRRNERILKREREDEGDEFADKEVFVTNSYKKTLEEFRELDEQDKRKEEAEAARAVGGAGSIMNFYSNLLDSQSFGGEKKPPPTTKKASSAAGPSKDTSVTRKDDRRQTSPTTTEDAPDGEQPATASPAKTGDAAEPQVRFAETVAKSTNMPPPPPVEEADHAKVRRNTKSDIDAKRQAYLERKRRKLEALP